MYNVKQVKTLQVEFKTRQQLNRFYRNLLKGDGLLKYITGKGERTLFLEFDTPNIREEVKRVFLQSVPNIHREVLPNGLDVLKII
jgi:hypothetical protein